MNLKITLITPPPLEFSKSSVLIENPLEFEVKGIWDEVRQLGSDVPLAALKAFSVQTVNPYETWVCLDLVHLHATRDHLVLIDPAGITMTKGETLELKSSVQEVLNHYIPSQLVHYQNSWLFNTDIYSSLKSSSIELTKGRNIDIWMPKDTNLSGIAKQWRQLQNEIQMIWHDHPVNQNRMARGQPTINSVWLSGIGSLSQITPHTPLLSSQTLHGNDPLLNDLGKFLNKPTHQLDPKTMIQLKSGSHYIDARYQSTTQEWDDVWHACLTLLHQKALTEIQLISEYQHQSVSTSISIDHLKGSFLQKLLFKKDYLQQQYPNWSQISPKLSWTMDS